MTTTTSTPTAQSVTALRKAGQIQEAYKQARALCTADPDNIWNRRAMAWVYTDLLKDAAGQPNPARLLSGLRQLTCLNMPTDESLWREQVLWPVAKFLLRVPTETLSLADLSGLVSGARLFLNAEPSLVRSVYWKALLRHKQNGLDWIGMLANGGWASFRAEDYQPDTSAPGTPGADKRPTPAQGPLVERVCMAAARQLLETAPRLETDLLPLANRLGELIKQYPDWLLLPYYQARLLLAVDRRIEALRVYLPFARRKSREYWVWAGLAELFADEPDTALACCAMALCQPSPDGFLVKVRQQTAQRLISLDRWPEARVEIDRLVATRQREGWKIPAEVTAWLNDDHYTQLDKKDLPHHWADGYQTAAQALLWQDLPERVALVTAVDAGRQMVSYVIDMETEGFFPYKSFGLSPAVGDVLLLRLSIRTSNGKTVGQVQTARSTTEIAPAIGLKVVTGPLRMHERGFGFVQDAFVSAELIIRLNLKANEPINLSAHEAIDTRKQKKGWKAFDRVNNAVSSTG